MRAVPVLAEALEEGDTHQRRAASNASWEIGDANAQGLLEMLYHADTALRDMIARALDLSGWLPDDVEIETAYYITTGQWQACIALGRVAVPILMGVLNSWDGNMRRAAAWVLGEIGDPLAVEGLIGRLCDTEGGLFGVGDRVCDVAAEALAKIGTSEALVEIDMVQDMRRGE